MSPRNASNRPTRPRTRAADATTRANHHAAAPPPTRVDPDAVAGAAARRVAIRAEGHNALRVVHGAGDGLPGLWIDDFAGHWLAQTAGARPPHDLDRLAALPGVRSVYWKRLARQAATTSPVHIAGGQPAGPFDVVENGLTYRIDFAAGNSQGLFLDQRGNRAEVLRGARGLRVLNAFAYTCAFGVAAAAGGGAEVVNLDLSRRSLAWGQTNYALNGLDARDEDFIRGDVFDWLARFARRGRLFDLVILDPPTFARGARHGDFRVARDYGRLAELALRVLAPGGRLLAFANEHRLTLADFRRQLTTAAEGAGLAIIEATDRVATDFPGSRHLKRITVAPR